MVPDFISPLSKACCIVSFNISLLRKMKENIDFSFINPMLRKQYCENFGRPAKEFHEKFLYFPVAAGRYPFLQSQ